MENKKETEINKHVKAAVVGLDTATTSEDEVKREKFKNNLIKCYEQYPEFRPAVDSAYLVTKRDFEKQGKTVEYGRLMEIGNELGIEKKLQEEKLKEEKQTWVSRVSKKSENNLYR